jgi:hypothetical protein
MSTSKRYNELRDEVVTQYMLEPPESGSRYWWHHYAPLWRNRVGIPRLAAEVAVMEAAGLLRSINLSTFRNDPDLWNKLIDARDAVSELSQAVGADNWDRFKGRKS